MPRLKKKSYDMIRNSNKMKKRLKKAITSTEDNIGGNKNKLEDIKNISCSGDNTTNADLSTVESCSTTKASKILRTTQVSSEKAVEKTDKIKKSAVKAVSEKKPVENGKDSRSVDDTEDTNDCETKENGSLSKDYTHDAPVQRKSDGDDVPDGAIQEDVSLQKKPKLDEDEAPVESGEAESVVSETQMSSDNPWVVVGLSGVTCGGKTSLAEALKTSFPGAVILSQDAYFLPPEDKRHTLLPHLDNHVNWEITSALDMAKMIDDIKEILSRPRSDDSVPLLIIDGYLIFTDRFISSLCHHKLFFTLPQEECYRRRNTRTYTGNALCTPDVPGYFEDVIWPHYERHLPLALDNNSDMIFIDGTRATESILQDILPKLSTQLGHTSDIFFDNKQI